MRALKRAVRGALRHAGYELRPTLAAEFDPTFLAHYAQMQDVGPVDLKAASTFDAVAYVIGRNVPGAFAECGVWRGRQMTLIAQALLQRGVTDRDLYLYDTFSGMVSPTPEDSSRVQQEWQDRRKLEDGTTTWNRAELADVQSVMARSGYPANRVHFIVGDVRTRLPSHPQSPIALLRLDTDFYASIRAGLERLYPCVSSGGVLLIDDYGAARYPGVRRAVDEYFATRPTFLLRTQSPAERAAVKVSSAGAS